MIPFGEWRPDMPELSQWAREALNVVPAEESYRQLNGLSGVTNALTARARGMGFKVDRPLFHGTPAPDFPAFAPLPPWEAVRTGRAPGIWTAENPEVAANFSAPELRERVRLAAPPGNPVSRESTPRILPLFGRSENAAPPLTLAPGDRWGDINRTIADLFAGGHDAVQLRNYRMFPELGPQSIWGFRDPNQLRSWFAAFDPEKRGSSDLMAGLAVPGPAPTPGFRVSPTDDAPGRHAFRPMINDERVY